MVKAPPSKLGSLTPITPTTIPVFQDDGRRDVAVNVTMFDWREIVETRACSSVDPRMCECLMKLRLEDELISIPGPQPTVADAENLTLSNTSSDPCRLAGFPLESVPTKAGRQEVIRIFSKVT
jgi:hypothetical protein